MVNVKIKKILHPNTKLVVIDRNKDTHGISVFKNVNDLKLKEGMEIEVNLETKEIIKIV